MTVGNCVDMLLTISQIGIGGLILGFSSGLQKTQFLFNQLLFIGRISYKYNALICVSNTKNIFFASK